MHGEDHDENKNGENDDVEMSALDQTVVDQIEKQEEELKQSAEKDNVEVKEAVAAIGKVLSAAVDGSSSGSATIPAAVIDKPASSDEISEYSGEDVVTFHADPQDAKAKEELKNKEEATAKHMAYLQSDEHKEEVKNRMWAKMAAAIGLLSVAATIIVPALQYKHDLDKDAPPPADVPPATWEQIRDIILGWKQEMTDDSLFWNRLATYVDNKEKPVLSELEQMQFCNMAIVIFTNDPIPIATPASENTETEWKWTNDQKLAAFKQLFAFYQNNLKITDMYRAIAPLVVERQNANTGANCKSVMNKQVAAVVLQLCLQQVYEYQHPIPKFSTITPFSSSFDKKPSVHKKGCNNFTMHMWKQHLCATCGAPKTAHVLVSAGTPAGSTAVGPNGASFSLRPSKTNLSPPSLSAKSAIHVTAGTGLAHASTPHSASDTTAVTAASALPLVRARAQAYAPCTKDERQRQEDTWAAIYAATCSNGGPVLFRVITDSSTFALQAQLTVANVDSYQASQRKHGTDTNMNNSTGYDPLVACLAQREYELAQVHAYIDWLRQTTAESMSKMSTSTPLNQQSGSVHGIVASEASSAILNMAATLSWATEFGPFLSAGFDLFGSVIGDSSKANAEALFLNIMSGVEDIVQTSKRQDLIDTVTTCASWFRIQIGYHSRLSIDFMDTELKAANGLTALFAPNRYSLWGATNAISLLMGDNQAMISAWQAGNTLLMMAYKTLCVFAAQLSTYYREGSAADEQQYLKYLDTFYTWFGGWENAVDDAVNLADAMFADMKTRRPAAINIQYQFKYEWFNSDTDNGTAWHDPPMRNGDTEFNGWVVDSWGPDSVGGKPSPRGTNGKDFVRELAYLNQLRNSYQDEALSSFNSVIKDMIDTVTQWRSGVKAFRSWVPPPAAIENVVLASEEEAKAGHTTQWQTISQLSHDREAVSKVWISGTLVFYYVRYWNSKGLSPLGPSYNLKAIQVPNDSCHPLLVIPADVTGMAAAIWLYRSFDATALNPIRIAQLKDLDKYTVTLSDGTKQIQYQDVNDIP